MPGTFMRSKRIALVIILKGARRLADDNEHNFFHDDPYGFAKFQHEKVLKGIIRRQAKVSESMINSAL